MSAPQEPSTVSWLGSMLARKPPMPVMVALANKMGRVAWALLSKGVAYQTPLVTALRQRARGRQRRRGDEGKVWRNVGQTGLGKPDAWRASLK